MKIINLIEVLQDESSIEEYLINIGLLQRFDNCIYCESNSLGNVRRGKIKCYNCQREWNKRKYSILENLRVDFKVLVIFLQLYELNIPKHLIINELSITEKAYYKLEKIAKNVGGC
ncbi:MAG: hypothetical protein PVH88_15380 [Ignavibacteria bacterium]|jgi:hypothetical protein